MGKTTYKYGEFQQNWGCVINFFIFVYKAHNKQVGILWFTGFPAQQMHELRNLRKAEEVFQTPHMTLTNRKVFESDYKISNHTLSKTFQISFLFELSNSSNLSNTNATLSFDRNHGPATSNSTHLSNRFITIGQQFQDDIIKDSVIKDKAKKHGPQAAPCIDYLTIVRLNVVVVAQQITVTLIIASTRLSPLLAFPRVYS